MSLAQAKERVAELVDGLLLGNSPGKTTIVGFISQPTDPKFGHLTLPVFRFTPKGEKPPVYAEKLANELNLSTDNFRFESVGPYINIFLDEKQMNKDILASAVAAPKIPGKDAQQVMVEFVSPNTNKPLHLGHVRNMALGESIARLLEHQGHRVLRAQIINDRGVHICKSMLAYQRFGKGETPQSIDMKGDYFVGKYYVLFKQKADADPKLEEEAQFMLQRWEQDDPTVRELWEKMNAWWFEGVQQSYRLFGIQFDKNYYESMIYDKGKNIALAAYESGKFIKLENGAIAAPLKSFGLPDKVVLRSDGTTMYVTQDIYLAQQRFRDYPELGKIIYVVGSEQDLHFQQLFAILQLLGVPQARQCYHLSYGLIEKPGGERCPRAQGRRSMPTKHSMRSIAWPATNC
ncbi:MAG: arginine--tRNA ligase [Candidatus Iainarchaeum archaeon]|uniref:Arginine--tRNA ligase n=1 Tax=Candidatus Iainarchaeum sp. TaxID=3101447 RepID=A0A7T9DIS2_9ARCH|nr:MAG: arginine--tRNA ligase [Candidatus Diapherotrites archaeon]